MRNVIVSFKNQATEDIFNSKNTKSARKLCPQSLRKVASRKLDQLDSVLNIEELKVPPGNRLESLSGNIRVGQYSMPMVGQISMPLYRQWQLYCLVHNIEKLNNYGNMAH